MLRNTKPHFPPLPSHFVRRCIASKKTLHCLKRDAASPQKRRSVVLRSNKEASPKTVRLLCPYSCTVVHFFSWSLDHLVTCSRLILSHCFHTYHFCHLVRIFCPLMM